MIKTITYRQSCLLRKLGVNEFNKVMSIEEAEMLIQNTLTNTKTTKATDNQKKFLNDLNIQFNEELTKKEANTLIRANISKATENQKNLMKDMNIYFKQDITKIEANKLIKQKINN